MVMILTCCTWTVQPNQTIRVSKRSDTNKELNEEEVQEDEDEVRGDAQEVMDEGIPEELENLSCQEEVCKNG